MKIFGINFTESPSTKRPITIAYCVFKKSHGLSVNKVEFFPIISDFELFLKEKGPWFAGVKFPIGQPKHFLDKMFLPSGWNDYIKEIWWDWVGLSISRRFCLLVGGDIQVKSFLNENLPSPFICPSKWLPKPPYVAGKVIDSYINSKRPFRFFYCQ
jgi:hypothetical protein